MVTVTVFCGGGAGDDDVAPTATAAIAPAASEAVTPTAASILLVFIFIPHFQIM
jgi:hypothetical protein